MNDDIGQLRQFKGYSMDMMADFLGSSLEEYAELEFGVRQPEPEEAVILQELFAKI